MSSISFRDAFDRAKNAFSEFSSKPMGAGVAGFVSFYGFKAKSALQRGEKRPRLTPDFKAQDLKNFPKGKFLRTIAKRQAVIVAKLVAESAKAAPDLAAAVGIQLILQEKVEPIIYKNIFKGESKKDGSLPAEAISAAIVAAVTSPFLAAYNKKTMGYRFLESFKKISPKQVGAITVRDTKFIFSIRVSKPLGEKLKQYNDTQSTENIASFIAGYLGSLAGHYADTALTLFQKNMKISSLSQLMRGANTKAVTVGIFTILYNNATDFFERRNKK